MDQENVLQFIINLSVNLTRIENDYVRQIKQLKDELAEQIKAIEARADLGIRNDETLTKLLNWMMVENYKNKEVVTTSDSEPIARGDWAATTGGDLDAIDSER